jgi:hypothetical protein
MHEVERTPTHCRHTTSGMKRDTTDEIIIVRCSPQADVVTNWIRLQDDYLHSAGNLWRNLPRATPRHASTGCALLPRSSLGLSLERVVTGVWVEHHRGSTRRQCAGESRTPGRTLDVVRRSA